jgi:hypothetical protein
VPDTASIEGVKASLEVGGIDVHPIPLEEGRGPIARVPAHAATIPASARGRVEGEIEGETDILDD